MSLFCPGWGRRRKDLTREASQYRRSRTSSDAVSDVSSRAPCGCGGGSKKKDVYKQDRAYPSDDGGVFIGTETNNNKACIAYFDNTLLAEQGTPYNHHRETGNPNEGIKETHTGASTSAPTSFPITSLTESLGVGRNSTRPDRVFIPPWIRNSRYLPSIDDVDIDQIDSISIDSYQSSLDQMVRNLPHMSLSPINVNSDDKVSESYSNVPKRVYAYSSTPVQNDTVRDVNVAPRVMVTSPEVAGRIGRENRLGLIMSEVLSPENRLPNPKMAARRLSFNRSLEQRRFEKQLKGISAHRNETVPLLENIERGTKENTSPGVATNALRRHPSFPRQSSKFDLRRKALTRNLYQKVTRDFGGMNEVTSAWSVTQVDSTVPLQVNKNSDHPASSTTSGIDTLPSQELLPVESSTETSSGEDDTIHMPRFVNNSARHIGNLVSSQESDSDTSLTDSSASSSSLSSLAEEYNDYTTEVRTSHNILEKLKTQQKARPFESSDHADGKRNAKPPIHKGATRRQARSAIVDISDVLIQEMNEIDGLIPDDNITSCGGTLLESNQVSNQDIQANGKSKSILQAQQERNFLSHKANTKRSIRRQRDAVKERYHTLVETYVVIKDHTSGEIDECNVEVGDIVFVSSEQQRNDQVDWMWVMVAETGNLGYIPAFSARPVDLQSSIV